MQVNANRIPNEHSNTNAHESDGNAIRLYGTDTLS